MVFSQRHLNGWEPQITHESGEPT